MDVDAVTALLKKKKQVYKANGNVIMAGLVQEILDKGPAAVAATTHVSLFDPHMGSGKRLRLRDTPTPMERRLYDNLGSRFNFQAAESMVQRMALDPVFEADVKHLLRRPKRVNKTRHQIAGRSAAKEPMLNASPDSIRNALAYREPTHNDRLPKGRVYATLIVKPMNSRAAKLEHHSAFWGERRWVVYTLRYTSGYVLVTDKGSESKRFHSFGELKSAVTKSGWEVVR